MSSPAEAIQNRLTEERLSRFPNFVVVCAFAWTCFGLDGALFGHMISAAICFSAAAMSVGFFSLIRSGLCDRKNLANPFIGVTLIMLCAMGLVTGQSESYSTLFLCCFGVFASHMFGIRSSLLWSIIAMLCLVAINYEFIVGKLPVPHVHTVWDKTTHCIGVTLVIYFFTYQAQHYFNVQTGELVNLTRSLKEKADAFEKLAQFDTLTGLFNRHSFERQIKLSLEQASNHKTKVALLLLDLDGFKQINDTQGHKTGDAILKAVADRLTQVVKSEKLAARLGGDEFTVIMEEVNAPAQIVTFGNELAKALTRPYSLGDTEYSLGVSIGAAIYPDHAAKADELLAYADTAMYEGKKNQSSLVLYRPSMTDELVQKRRLESQLATALDNNEFQLFFQPQLDVGSNQIVGMEALLRWNRHGRWIPPNEFIGPLESNREIKAVGRWSLIQACHQCREWRQMGHDLTVSVNVSSVQFQDPQMLEIVYEAIESSGIDPASLDIEITESILIDDISQTSKTLEQLREIGVSVSIDDFGTGYSSLSYLRDLPLTRLKIDRTFIKGIPNTDDGVIAQTIVDLGHNLNLEVLAEGVETRAQLDFLRQHRCDHYQGFVFARPHPSEKIALLLETAGTSSSTPLDSKV